MCGEEGVSHLPCFIAVQVVVDVANPLLDVLGDGGGVAEEEGACSHKVLDEMQESVDVLCGRRTACWSADLMSFLVQPWPSIALRWRMSISR